MEDFPNSINRKASILISRNTPLAVVVGSAGFIGSNLVDQLLNKGIQVIGIDDFSLGEKINLTEAIKNKQFHLINDSIESSEILNRLAALNLERLDYVFITTDSEHPESVYGKGLFLILEFIKRLRNELYFKDKEPKGRLSEKDIASEKPRIVFVTHTDIYDSKLTHSKKLLKEAEIRFASYSKDNQLNSRIVRLSSVYGPRMHFREDEPMSRLIQASLLGRLNDESINTEFTTRAVYIDDAVQLIIKSVLSGGTSGKIFDGSLIHPLKISDVKQVLLDPLWFETKGFKETELPPWPTPNLKRTLKELNWKPTSPLLKSLRETIAYFKDFNAPIPEQREKVFESIGKKWSFKNYEADLSAKERQEVEQGEEGEDDLQDQSQRSAEKDKKFTIERGSAKFKKNLTFLIIASIIFFGLLYPTVSLAIGGLSIRNYLKTSREALEEGNFNKANGEIKKAQRAVDDTRELVSSFAVLKRLNIFSSQIGQFEELMGLVDEGVDGVAFAASGSQALYQTTKVISGEDKQDPAPLYQKAQTDLTNANQKISKVAAKLGDKSYSSQFPQFIGSRMSDMSTRLNYYSDLVDKARSGSFLLPEITAVDGKKSYLILLQNNLELRPAGGFIGSYAKVNFEKGKITNIKVDDIYNLDGGLKDVIEPPAELKNDLGVDRWYLRDSNFDPDFPTSARQAELFYKREGGEPINGVIAMDLSASGKLLSAVGGLDLPEYGEHVNGDNLFEKAITHAEVGFFPGSQAKKNYLVSLQNQLFNKIFYLSKQNWPGIIQAVGESLEQKHMMIYLSDPALFSYLASTNWAGVFPRGANNLEGETNDFLAVIESNMGANKANYFLTRNYRLTTAISKENIPLHKLVVNYQNNSPSNVFPAGVYKNRVRVYLPLGSSLTKAVFGETDITKNVATFSDHGRTAFSMLVELQPKEKKPLILEYSLPQPLNFKDNKVAYKLDVFKQPGTEKDQFEWQLSYPINLKAGNMPEGSTTSKQEIIISTDLQKDRSFLINFTKK